MANATGRVTAKDVAKHAGVSQSLVSMYLGGNPKAWLSAETKQKIDEAVKTLDYRPNTLARALRSGKTKTIGLVMGCLTNPGNAFLADAFMNAAEKHGYRLFISVTRFDREREREALQQMLHCQTDGIIYDFLPEVNSDFLQRFRSGGIPILLFNKYPEFALDCVYFDLHPGLRDAALHLAKQGCRRIFCQTGSEDRERMVESASRESGVPLESFAYDHLKDEAERTMGWIRRERPDTLILFSRKLVRLVAETPGYHPRIICHYTLPMLHYRPGECDGVIHHPYPLWVEKSMETLIRRIENPGTAKVELGIPTEFLSRAEHAALYREQCDDPYYQVDQQQEQ